MRAIVFLSPGDFRLEKRDIPSPGLGEVLVRVGAAGVCGTDLRISCGTAPAAFPVVPGHEFSGEVAAVGPGVDRLTPGDRVAVDPNIVDCPGCEACRRGRPHLCSNLDAVGVDRDGGFAEYCLVPAGQVYLLPEEVSLEEGAMVEPLSCCLHGLDLLRISAGERVALIGGGFIGLMLLQLCLLAGASRVVLSDPSPAKRRLAVELGASAAAGPDEIEEMVLEGFDGGADAVIEAVGREETVRQALRLPRPGGRLLLFGVAPGEARVEISPYDIFNRELTIMGSFINPFTFSRSLEMIASRRLRLEELVTHRLSLDDFGRALSPAPETIKSMVFPWS